MSPSDRRIESGQIVAAPLTPAQRLATLVGTYSIEMTAKDGDALSAAKDLIPQGHIGVHHLPGRRDRARARGGGGAGKELRLQAAATHLGPADCL